MAGKNTEQEHYFVGGMKRDTVNNVEDPKTYFFGVNGRLYSNNGKLSFSSNFLGSALFFAPIS